MVKIKNWHKQKKKINSLQIGSKYKLLRKNYRHKIINYSEKCGKNLNKRMGVDIQKLKDKMEVIRTVLQMQDEFNLVAMPLIDIIKCDCFGYNFVYPFEESEEQTEFEIEIGNYDKLRNIENFHDSDIKDNLQLHATNSSITIGQVDNFKLEEDSSNYGVFVSLNKISSKAENEIVLFSNKKLFHKSSSLSKQVIIEESEEDLLIDSLSDAHKELTSLLEINEKRNEETNAIVEELVYLLIESAVGRRSIFVQTIKEYNPLKVHFSNNNEYYKQKASNVQNRLSPYSYSCKNETRLGKYSLSTAVQYLFYICKEAFRFLCKVMIINEHASSQNNDTTTYIVQPGNKNKFC